MKKKCLVIIIFVIICLFMFTRKNPEYYEGKVVVNNQEYRLETHDNEEDNPSVTTIHLDIHDELEIKVLDGGCYSVWIEDTKGLELISKDEETIKKIPLNQRKDGESNSLIVYKYKVTDKSQLSLQMKNITIVEEEKHKTYDESEYLKKIIFDFK